MTFLTKPSLIVKKTPLIEEKCPDEERGAGAGAGAVRVSRGSGAGSLAWLSLAALLVAAAGLSAGLLLYRQYLRAAAAARYHGFCTIPIKDPALYESNYRVMPLRWSAEPDLAVAADDSDSEELERALREQLDIGDQIERISVVDNGRNVDFIHDFSANLTGIVDMERCFTMELDPELVLAPDVFVLSIEGGGDFDVSHVRSSLRAALPAMQQLALAMRELAERCADKPTYKLIKEEGVIIRKRALDGPPHDYMQFAGRHVQEIQISNLADLLQHEQQERGE